ncbi:uncharacterized protein LAESUDRAFT_726214 [Laetiporus sulphureus 93-53]|uniref:G-patch domain-containing protein n=1 Tax=Laetiporus sulphureus 93-53 TaxID=1314785 RepID=A0A165E7B8_9APHY|nr:uncharacterized protein LAESUDRAFT_726214 [Laetiporus sulphureus 93-53]KZT06381.1 hypothetical protein LAESUDRAFT_726214 [Laetiporus sulphureus 93-53]
MSAESIIRWNSIPLTLPEGEVDDNSQHALKRSRPDDDAKMNDNEDDDNMSLVSRSPSPDPRQVDPMNIDKYDEFVKRPLRETITVETKIKSTNKGFLMLAGMGWVEGQPLGLSGDGRVDPVPFYVKNDLTGLGKTSQDVEMIESTVAQRRELDSERQIKETEEQRKAREDTVARRVALQSEISSTLRAFYCELCDKQFRNVAQYDEHTNSYAHHHKARFRDMQAAQRASRNTKEEVDKRKEKERKREEKELRKIAKAAGVKMSKPATPAVVTSSIAAPIGGEDEAKPSGFKRPGWASIPPTASSTAVADIAAPAPSAIPKSSGWATVCSMATSSTPAPPSTESTSRPAGSQPSSGPAPAFRTGGWTSLDTGSTQPLPPASSRPPEPPACVPPLPLTSGQLSSTPPANPPLSLGGQSVASAPSQGGWARVSAPQILPAAASTPSTAVAQPAVPPRPRQEAARSGWQQFKASGPGRRR